ncbi:MAG: single-stranded-DNA-specific exonuclease RecJ [Clostridia bacterium]|nr:single-stranded-DNA-specific exonuclease RecJ [Clostridia bacterium]
MYRKNWKNKEIDQKKSADLAEALKISKLLADLLVVRSLDTPESAERFLDKEIPCLYDPFLLKDMDKAVARITRAIEKGEKVCIYGDYDVDGVTSTTLLYKYLLKRGVRCEYFIPERISEGYGLNLNVIKRFADDKIDLIITVDTGVTAIEETEYAKSLGIDMVITDHHRFRDVLPDAAAVIDPYREDCSYPFKQLAGVGVVFKLICAMEGEGGAKKILEEYGDIVAIGTIADVMPIIDENRYIAEVGLRILKNTSNLGLLSLMEKAGVIKPGKKSKKITSTVVGYIIAPRINAAGRITSANEAVDLLLADSEDKANAIAENLCEINRQRQITETEIFTQAVSMIDAKNNKVLVLSSDGWHQGVIGVVASRITEKFSLPSILISFEGDIGKGSGRSVKGFNIMEALEHCNEYLIEYGGHELAAGLSIERSKLDGFVKAINEYAESKLNFEDINQNIDVDCTVTLDDINLDSAKDIQRLEPFGLQNPTPVLMLKNVCISEVSSLASGKHTRFRIYSNKKGVPINAVYFGKSFDDFVFAPGDWVDILFTLEINDIYGTEDVQLFIKDINYCKRELDKLEEAQQILEKIDDDDNSERLPEGSIPTLAQFRSFFRFIRRDIISDESKKYNVLSLKRKLEKADETEIKIPAIVTIIKVLLEANLISTDFSSIYAPFFLSLNQYAGKKIDIDNSAVLNRIRSKHQ